MPKNFGYEIDGAIAYILSISGPLIESQRQLRRIIGSEEYLGRKIHEKTFRYRVKKMLKAGYIFKDKQKEQDWKQGKKLPLRLSSETREWIELGGLVLHYGEKKDGLGETPKSYRKLEKGERTTNRYFWLELKRKRIYYIILRVMSMETPNRGYKYPGVSLTDIINARYDGHAFYYLRLEDYRPLVEECIVNLLNLNIIKQISSIPEYEEPGYEFVETLHKEFIKDVSEQLEPDIMFRLHLVWQNLRPPTPQDRLYFEWCWGARGANGELRKVYNNLQENKKVNMHCNKNKKAKKDLIKSLDCNIINVVNDLKETYADLIKKHPFIWKTIIETVYPEYLQNDVEKIVKTSKYKERNYLEAKRVISKDTLSLTSVGRTSLLHKKPI